MDHNYWHKQAADKPLFPDLLWSRPEHTAQAGKLGIVGGNAHGFSAAAEAYMQADKAGIGTARVLLPDSLQKTVGRIFEAGEYAPSTPSGSFSQSALAEFLDLSGWAEAVLMAGDFGHNSETAIVLEQFISKYSGQLTLVGDAVDYFMSKPQTLLARPNTLLVVDLTQLQKLAVSDHFPQAFTSTIDFLQLVERLHAFNQQFIANIIVTQLDNLLVSVGGQVSSTKATSDESLVKIATHASVWWLQNPTKGFEALTSSLLPTL